MCFVNEYHSSHIMSSVPAQATHIHVQILRLISLASATYMKICLQQGISLLDDTLCIRKDLQNFTFVIFDMGSSPEYAIKFGDPEIHFADFFEKSNNMLYAYFRIGVLCAPYADGDDGGGDFRWLVYCSYDW